MMTVEELIILHDNIAELAAQGRQLAHATSLQEARLRLVLAQIEKLAREAVKEARRGLPCPAE